MNVRMWKSVLRQPIQSVCKRRDIVSLVLESRIVGIEFKICITRFGLWG
jgi:hypothetical protein